MDFDSLVKLIKDSGCRVIVYPNKSEFKLSSCTGSFFLTDNGPIIGMCTKGISKIKAKSTLLHEFAHFLQWKTGFLCRMDDFSDGWTIYEEWAKGNEFSPRELLRARNSVLLIEYDAELITLMLGEKLGIDLGKYYLHAIESYITLIKYAFETKKFPATAPYKYFKGRLLSREDLFAPITEHQLSVMNRRKRKLLY